MSERRNNNPRNRIKNVHARNMKSSRTNFVAASRCRTRFVASEIRAHNTALALTQRTQRFLVSQGLSLSAQSNEMDHPILYQVDDARNNNAGL